MKIDVRPATKADGAEWIRLRHELWPHCSEERHRLEIEQLIGGPGIVALAVVDSCVCGFAELSIRKDHVEGTATSPVPYLEGWYVERNWRGRGVGRALLDYCEQWARSLGYDEIASDAELENADSIEIHGKTGFREVGRSVHFVKRLQ